MPSKTDDFKSICMHNCPFGSSVSSNSPGLTCSSEASFSASGSLASGVPALDSVTSSQIFMRRFLLDIAIFFFGDLDSVFLQAQDKDFLGQLFQFICRLGRVLSRETEVRHRRGALHFLQHLICLVLDLNSFPDEATSLFIL
mmetsp:Transcript_69120/g.186252  ORF Transcript_69120/g.186252 Transcript_69120/m.186252 type:complete len:142 (-) Transcript_69120:189-614(-)